MVKTIYRSMIYFALIFIFGNDGYCETFSYSIKTIYYTDEHRSFEYNFDAGDAYPLPSQTNINYLNLPNVSGDTREYRFTYDNQKISLDKPSSRLLVSLEKPTGAAGLFEDQVGIGLAASTTPSETLADLTPIAGKNWQYAVRLANFGMASSIYNEVNISFNSNAIPGTINSPYGRINCKWIKGFHIGHYFDDQLVLGALVIANNGGTSLYQHDFGYRSEFGFTEGTTLNNVSRDSIIDLSMRVSDEGMKIAYYYRLNPSVNLSNNTGWIEFAQYTNPGTQFSTPFYGYPVNKAAISMYARATEFATEIPSNQINIGKNIQVVSATKEYKSAEQLRQEYGLTNFNPITEQQKVNIQINPNEIVLFRYAFSGYPVQIKELNPMKCLPNGTVIQFKNYISDYNTEQYGSGDWFITDASGFVLNQTSNLLANDHYYFNFFIRDNDHEFDLDPVQGFILDPTVVGIGGDSGGTGGDGKKGSSGGSGGGCMMNTDSSSSSAEWLLLAVLLLAVRPRRRSA